MRVLAALGHCPPQCGILGDGQLEDRTVDRPRDHGAGELPVHCSAGISFASRVEEVQPGRSSGSPEHRLVRLGPGIPVFQSRRRALDSVFRQAWALQRLGWARTIFDDEDYGMHVRVQTQSVGRGWRSDCQRGWPGIHEGHSAASGFEGSRDEDRYGVSKHCSPYTDTRGLVLHRWGCRQGEGEPWKLCDELAHLLVSRILRLSIRHWAIRCTMQYWYLRPASIPWCTHPRASRPLRGYGRRLCRSWTLPAFGALRACCVIERTQPGYPRIRNASQHGRKRLLWWGVYRAQDESIRKSAWSGFLLYSGRGIFWFNYASSCAFRLHNTLHRPRCRCQSYSSTRQKPDTDTLPWVREPHLPGPSESCFARSPSSRVGRSSKSSLRCSQVRRCSP